MSLQLDPRRMMVDCQIRPNKVTEDAVASALLAVSREAFVPKALRGVAYMDEDLPMGQGRFLLEPMVFAKMLQAAAIGRGDSVLDVACCTGYSTVVISKLAGAVIGLEQVEDFAGAADTALNELSVENAAIIQGALAEGYAQQAPYDVIIVNGAVEQVPETWLQQLADGGRLVVVQRGSDSVIGKAFEYQRIGERVAGRELFDAQTPLLPGFAQPPGFTFG